MATTPTVPSAAPAAAAAPAPVASPAPVSTPSPAPVETSTPAPVATPAVESTPAATPAAEPGGPWQSKLNRSEFRSTEEYSAALIKERFESLNLPAEEEEGAEPPAAAAAEPAAETTPAVGEVKTETPVPTEEEFALAVEPAVTPEILTQLAKDKPALQALLDSDPQLKNTLFKTAREAAEVSAWKKEFPDLKAAQYAKQHASTFVDVRETFLGSTSPEGAAKAVQKVMELCYERDDSGNVVMENGQPVIGDDFFGFANHIEQRGLEFRMQEVQQRLQANRYANDDERDADERRQSALEVLMEDLTPASTAKGNQDLPEDLKQKAAELDRREQALRDGETQRQQAERATFETRVVGEANQRITKGIDDIVASARRQGGNLPAYLEKSVRGNIALKLVKAMEADSTLQTQMRELRILNPSDSARTRRLEVIDRGVQNLLPDIARQELIEAGVSFVNSQKDKRDKIAGQEQATKVTEPKGSTSVANPNNQQPLTTEAAWAAAEKYWQKQNPGRSVKDPGVKSDLISIALRLKTGQPLA